jgi:hypothetical protein
MISKRRKTKTIRKNQKKRSNRGRRLHRMKMEGGLILNEKIPLAYFNGIENVTPTKRNNDDKNPINICYITKSHLDNRKSKLIEFKGLYDTHLDKMKTKIYNHEYFNYYIIKNIQEKTPPVFYSYSYIYGNNESLEQHHTPILPIIEEYVGAGFTLEQLLRAELEYITIDAILLVKVPNITKIVNADKSAEKIKRENAIMGIIDNVRSDGYDSTRLQ